uniref:Cytohesin Ubiquitin Protein Inducing domain-containing protein n=1 Tax=Timema cristinae TaxID=61476 RepID=A0A7R9CUR5_TIMCR|nr:unnamed protein product [Timema cristinae]
MDCECLLEKQDMVANLQARKEAIEVKLNDKIYELKLLCIQEAELTGILPPETPLEPGESPPVFRRRVGTAFTYPENLLNNKVKSKEEGMLANLELEYKIQHGIAEAALSLANEANTNKIVRRKHRLVYQQSQRRLTELETKLTSLRQGSTKSQQKQRKKPRPPLESDLEIVGSEEDTLLHDGISLSPLHQDHSSSLTGGHLENHDTPHFHMHRNYLPSHMGHSLSNGYDTWHDHAQLQRHNGGGVSSNVSNTNSSTGGSHQVNHFATVPTYSSSKNNYLGRHEHSLVSLGYFPYNDPISGDKVYYQTAPKQIQQIHVQPFQEIKVSRSSLNHGYWEVDRFGSLDRRKVHPSSYSNSTPCLEAWNSDNIDSHSSGYLGVDPKHKLDDENNHFILSGEKGRTLLPNQTYPKHSLGVDGQVLNTRVSNSNGPGYSYNKEFNDQRHTYIKSDQDNYPQNYNEYPSVKEKDNVNVHFNKDLQKYDNEENIIDYQQVAGIDHNIHLKGIFKIGLDINATKGMLRTHSMGSMEGNLRNTKEEILFRKQKEKHWYETSLDFGPSTPPVLDLHSPILQPEEAKKSAGVRDMSDCLPPTKILGSPIANKMSGPDLHSYTSDTSCMEVPLESPKNHTVVQVGKWQPYREVTKPFEMSDFYKYSTKFRKVKSQRLYEIPSPEIAVVDSYVGPRLSPGDKVYQQPYVNPNSETPVVQQKGVYQPLQPMKCQPLSPVSPQLDTRLWGAMHRQQTHTSPSFFV